MIRVNHPPFDLYDRAVLDGLELDSHESDLYLVATPHARQLVADSNLAYSSFIGNDGRVWLEVPFAFGPFWRARAQQVRS